MDQKRKWTGYWINNGRAMGTPNPTVFPAPYFRKTFSCAKTPKKTVIYLCGLGYHELYVNGKKADDRVLAPVVTQYEKHTCYIAYNVTKLLRKGKNAVAVLLGNGWYNNASDGWSFDKAPWRDYPKMICDVEADGKIIAKSDTSWKFHNSPVTFDGLRNGEYYDARLEIPGFSEPDFDDSQWPDAYQCFPSGGELVLEEMEPCKVMQTYQSISMKQLDEHTYIYDFGTNLAGWCRIHVKGSAGSAVVIQYGEQVRAVSGELERQEIARCVKDGNFQMDKYFLKGSSKAEVWEPSFTYHGFRYAQVILFGDAVLKKIEARFVHTAFPEAGSFESSSEMLNRLQHLTLQSYRSNFTGIPTDCPHREKNGWTGDAMLAMETGLWNFKAEKACTHFLEIVADTQRANGQLPGIAPTGGWGFNWGSGPAWDSVLFEYIWQMYRYCGNTENISRFYSNMKKYLEYCESMAENYLIRFGLGDWCHWSRDRIVTVELTSSGYWYWDMIRMVEFAKLMNRKDDVKYYSALAKKVRNAFNKKFLNKDYTYAKGEWTASAAALYFGIAEESDRQAIADKLVKQIRKNDHKVDFGIHGAKFVPRVLADYGYADDAYRLITQPEYPGWGWWVKQGATSLWENWNGRASQNHIMFGDISAWMYQYPAGVSPVEPGFKKFRIQPYFIKDLTSVRMSHETPYGLIRVQWQRKKKTIECRFEIPNGTSADIILPGAVRNDAQGTITLSVPVR